MIETLCDRTAIRRHIKGIPQSIWAAEAQVLIVDASEAYSDGRISAELYEAWIEVVGERQERTAAKASKDHDRFRGERATFGTAGSALVGVLKGVTVAKPVAAKRRDPAERCARIRTARRQADRRKAPAECSEHYTRGQLAAFRSDRTMAVERAGGAPIR